FLQCRKFPRYILDTESSAAIVLNYHNDWCVLQNWRINWENMLKPCDGKISWQKRNVYSDLRTDASKSYIKKMDLKPAGAFSRFWIQSIDVKGRPKLFGGDSWRVYVRQGPSSVAPIVLDNNNGIYEVVVLMMEPGSYKATIVLDYTLCDGLREPPDNWFINELQFLRIETFKSKNRKRKICQACRGRIDIEKKCKKLEEIECKEQAFQTEWAEEIEHCITEVMESMKNVSCFKLEIDRTMVPKKMGTLKDISLYGNFQFPVNGEHTGGLIARSLAAVGKELTKTKAQLQKISQRTSPLAGATGSSISCEHHVPEPAVSQAPSQPIEAYSVRFIQHAPEPLQLPHLQEGCNTDSMLCPAGGYALKKSSGKRVVFTLEQKEVMISFYNRQANAGVRADPKDVIVCMRERGIQALKETQIRAWWSSYHQKRKRMMATFREQSLGRQSDSSPSTQAPSPQQSSATPSTQAPSPQQSSATPSSQAPSSQQPSATPSTQAPSPQQSSATPSTQAPSPQTAQRYPINTGSITTTTQRYPIFTGSIITTAQRYPIYTGSITTTVQCYPIYTGSITTTVQCYPIYTGSIITTVQRYPIYTGSITTTAQRYPIYTGFIITTVQCYPIYTCSITTTAQRYPIFTGSIITTAQRYPIYTGYITTTVQCYPIYTGSIITTVQRYPIYTGSITTTAQRYPIYTGFIITTVQCYPIYTGSIITTVQRYPIYTGSITTTAQRYPIYTGFIITTVHKTVVINVGSSSQSVDEGLVITYNPNEDGTDHGTYLDPKEGMLGNIEQDYIKTYLGNQPHYTFSISRPHDVNGDGKSQSCPIQSCSRIWDGHGYWKDKHWFSYKPHQDKLADRHSSPPDKPALNRSGTLWVYGDSLAMRFTESIQSRTLCTKIFNKCAYTYNWIYEVKDKRHPLKIRTSFNKTIILNKLRQIIHREDVNQPSSAFLFSFGVHFPISLTFEAYKDLIDSVIFLLKGSVYQGIPIWKTTTALEREKINRRPWPAKPLNFTMFRFLTTQRNQLFHTYSMSAMCVAGIQVLDVYPISAAFNEGTLDYVHYNDSVFYPAEKALERFIISSRKQRQSAVEFDSIQ
ncbi:hypothetical protein QZH41_014534, partial [Actinostola sp. cb2023]